MRKKLDNELIYTTALSLFAKYGYKKTTWEDVASALGMTNSNIYSYANSKQDLYIESVTYGIDQWQDSVRQATSGIESATEELGVAFKSAVDYIAYNKTIQTLLQNDPSLFPMFPTVDPIEELNSWAIDFIKKIIDKGIKQGEFRNVNSKEAAQLLFNFYKYFIISAFVEDNGLVTDASSQMSTMSTIIFDGILNK